VFSRRTSRRSLLLGTVTGGALAAVAATGHDRSVDQSRPAEAPADPQTREFELTAEELEWEIMPGVTNRAWGYNGQTPGPELRVREGDLVRVTLRNRLSVPTTVHWHGIHLRPEMDGPAGLNQEAVAPGDDFVYEFVAQPAGTRWYHSHADPQLQVPMGLYGPLIVEPKSPTRSYTYDREYTLMLGEWDSELTPDVAAGRAERGPKDQQLRGGELGADMFLVNGRAHGAIAPVVVKEGERVLLRMINAGHLAHPVHMHGHSFKIVATDGNSVPEGMEWTKDTVLIGPAERYDLEFDANNPGVWMFHCHIEHHMANGMMTVIQYEGHRPTGPAAEFFDQTTIVQTPVSGHGAHGTTAPATETPAPTPVEVAPQGIIPADGAVISMVDDRFEPVTLEVPAGTTVTWVNNGADWHSVAAYDGSFESAKLASGQTFSQAFPRPGTYKYICKHHGLQGMIGQIIVT
jgi:FtsP/CotA-like multicopper oxidase with cupredoxin domain